MAQIEIFVSTHCFGCREARKIAAAVAERFTDLSVRVVDLEAEPDSKPEQVVAVPAYLLDGTVISLGNPRQNDLFQEIEHALAAERAGRR